MKKSIKVNAVLNVLQNTCHIIIPLVIFPYLSRVLGPESYGKYSFANSVSSYFLLIAALGINIYAVREGGRIRDDKEKIEQFSSEVLTINCISVVFSFGILICFLSFSKTLAEYRTMLLILSLIMPCTCFGRDWLNTIYEDYFYITIRYILVQIIGIFMVFAFVRDSSDFVVYTVIYTFTTVAGHLLNLFYTQKYVKIRLTLHPNFRKHFIPIVILFCGQIATTVYIQSDITMLGLMASDTEVGIYSIASKTYIIIKSVLGALTTVTIPRIVYYLGKGDQANYNLFLERLKDYLLLLGVPAAIGMFFLSDNILLIIGGNEYLPGISTLQILSIALVVALLSGYYCNAILIPNRKEKDFLWITSISAAINIVLNLFFIRKLGMAGAAITTLISEIVVLVLSWYKSRNLVDFSAEIKNQKSVICGAVAVGVVCTVSKMFVSNSVMQLIIAFSGSVIAYGVILLLMKNAIVLENWKKITKHF